MTVALGQYVNMVNPAHDQSPDTFLVTWQYANFLMSFTNAVPNDRGLRPSGELLLRSARHAAGAPRRLRSPAQSAGSRRWRRRARRRWSWRAWCTWRSSTPAARGSRASAARYKRVPYAENYNDDPHTTAHARNFLDCIKSRQKPVSNLEVGFYATLPTILGVMALREQRAIKWDDKDLKASKV